MALRWIESFDRYDDTSGDNISTILSTKYSNVSSLLTLFTPRIGSYGFSCGSTSVSREFSTPVFPFNNTWIVGFGFMPLNMPTSNNPLCSFRVGASLECVLTLNSVGNLSILRGSTPLVDTLTTVKINTWNYIEARVLISNTVGEASIRLNGVLEASATSLDTSGSGFEGASNILFRNSQGGYFDDIYILDGTGTMTDFLGDQQAIGLYPESAGSFSDWTSTEGTNFDAVDDNPSDGDTSYNSTSTATDRDTYNYLDLSHTTVDNTISTVNGVQINTIGRKTDVGVRIISNTVNVSGTNFDYGTHGLADDYTYHHDVVEENPVTVAPWTTTNIDDIEFGFVLNS